MLCLASVLIFGLSSLWIGFHQEFSHLAEPEYCWCSNGLIFPFLPNIRKRWASTHRRGCKENIRKNKKTPDGHLLTLFQSTFQNFVGINPILFLLYIVGGEGKNMCVCTEHIILEQGAELNVHFGVLSLIRSPFSTQENLNNEPVLSPG